MGSPARTTLNDRRSRAWPLDATGTALVCLIAAGVLGRLALAWASTGSNDIPIWLTHAKSVAAHGIRWAFENKSNYNHPPLMGWWSVLSLHVSGGNLRVFAWAIKFPGLLSELGSLWLLYRIWSDRAGVRAGLVAAAGYSLALSPLLVSGYHGNTDAAYAFLVLLAVWLIESRRTYFLGGLALAAALNVKIIPVLLVPVFLARCRTWREALSFTGGVSLSLLPFAPFLLTSFSAVWRNVVSYNSNQDNWGLMTFWILSRKDAVAGPYVNAFAEVYIPYARYLIVGLIVALAAVAKWRPRWSLYELTSIVFALFLILTPGFGVQYTVMLAPVLFACSIRRGWVYSLLAGLFIGVVYAYFRRPGFPLNSHFTLLFPMPAPLFGILAWGYLIQCAASLLRKPPQPVSAPS